jgi:hypothetical protein
VLGKIRTSRISSDGRRNFNFYSMYTEAVAALFAERVLVAVFKIQRTKIINIGRVNFQS